jgi:hypothetical protein
MAARLIAALAVGLTVVALLAPPQAFETSLAQAAYPFHAYLPLALRNASPGDNGTPPGLLLGRVWIQSEAGGALTGLWDRRGDSNSFDARWINTGDGRYELITATVTIDIIGPNVSVARRSSSDGNDCDYVGTLAADLVSVAGNYRCTRDQTARPWSATITTPPSDALRQVWNESEASGVLVGTWTRRGTSNDFDALWANRSTSERITALLTIDVAGSTVWVRRRSSSDGNDCDYVGTLSADRRGVSGGYACHGNRSWNPSWTAQIQ